MSSASREYTVVGAGAIGGTLAWHLAKAGHPVTVVDADPAHVAAIARDGIVLERGGVRQAQTVTAAYTPEQVSAPLGRVLLAVKAQATETAIGWIAQHLAGDGYVVSLQNGLNEELIAAHVGADRTVGAFVDLFADVIAPGVINDGGAGAMAIGEMDGTVSERVRDLVADLSVWGPVVATGNVPGYLWSKLGFGAMLIATALVDDAMGDLLDRHRPAGHALVREVFQVAAAEGIALEPFDAFEPSAYRGGAEPGESDDATDRLVAWLRTQAKTRSGVWRDIAVRHRPTEVPTQYDPVVATADRHGIAVPVLHALLSQIAEVEADPASMSESRLDLLDAAAKGARVMSDPAISTADATALLEHVRAGIPDMLDDLGEYVRLETPSDDPAALVAGRDWVVSWIEGRLGAPATARTEPGAPHGDTVVLDYPGTGAGEQAGTVVLLAHYDTVWPIGTLAELPFTVDGDVIRGPGVFDMKAGLVQAIWALRALRATGRACPPVRLVLNGDEEIGSPASRPVIEEACRGAAAVLVFEASADGAVKTARKGVGLFDVTLTGIEAHAGLDPTAGASAITALAEFITAATALTDLAAGTTVNVGVVGGGTRRNVTAGSAHAGIDVRVADQAEADRVESALTTWRPADPRVTVRLDGGWNRPVMARTPAVAGLYEQARSVAALLGVELRETAVGGASDGNFAAALGVPVLDGFGAVGAGAHARNEHATVTGMIERTALAAALLASFETS